MNGSKICFIPARSGSKRLENKNQEEVSGLTLIGWAILAAKLTDVFDEIVLSSDSEKYFTDALIEIEELGMSTDDIKLDKRDRADAGSKIKIFDYIKTGFRHPVMSEPYGMLVQMLPTSPFRQVSLIRESITQFAKTKKSSFAAAPYDFHVSFAFETLNGSWSPLLGHESPMVSGQTQSQDQKKYLHPCGSFYIINTGCIQNMQTIYHQSEPIEVDRLSALDVDTAEDLDYLRLLAADPRTILNR